MTKYVCTIVFLSFLFFISGCKYKKNEKFVKCLKSQKINGDYIRILEIDGCEYISSAKTIIHKENCKNCKGKNYENNEKRTTFDFFNK